MVEESGAVGVEEQEEIPHEVLLHDAEIVGKLEEFCSSGAFTSWVGEFQVQHCHKFTDAEDQPLECYELFKVYSADINEKLESFLKEHDITSESMYDSLDRMEQVQPGFLFCLDIIMAAVEYIDFAQMMLDFRGPMEPEEPEPGQKEQI